MCKRTKLSFCLGPVLYIICILLHPYFILGLEQFVKSEIHPMRL